PGADFCVPVDLLVCVVVVFVVNSAIFSLSIHPLVVIPVPAKRGGICSAVHWAGATVELLQSCPDTCCFPWVNFQLTSTSFWTCAYATHFCLRLCGEPIS